MKIKPYILFLEIVLLVNSYVMNIQGIEDKNSLNVNIKYNIVYARDGKKILDTGDVLIRDKDIYISLEDVQEILGDQISFKDNTVNISSKPQIEKNEGQAIKQSITINKAKIIDIDRIEETVSIISYDAADEPYSEIVLKVNEKCEMIYEEFNQPIPFNMLTEGMLISAEYEKEYNSLEERYPEALQIIILEEKKQEEEPDTIIEYVEILGIYQDRGYMKVAYSDKDKVAIENQIIVHIDVNTNIKDENDRPYLIEDLAIGDKIQIITNGILTRSMPPQTLGLGIIIIDKSRT